MVDTPTAGYDYTQSSMYRYGTPEARQELESQHQLDISRQGMESYGKEWLKNREAYYTALQNQAIASSKPGLAQQYADALKSQRLAAAAKGNIQGSNVGYQNAMAWGQYQTGLGQASMYGQQLATQQKSQDQEAINNWLQYVYQQGAAQNAQYGARRSQIQENAAITAQWQRALQMAMEQDQARQDQRSQMYGTMLSTMGQNIGSSGGGGGGGMGGMSSFGGGGK